ncbi:MAG: hypothetical protein M3Q57_03130 [Pseudomonadota bacterium]|nr:hypothetical protein [Pseudomonadota bacterium]
MKYYGLIEVTGDGIGRRVRISEIAKRILLDEREDDTERRGLIREVALSPSAHKMLLQEYKEGLASDGTVLHFLVLTKHFNQDAARDLLKEYKDTASYIDLYEPQKNVDKSEGEVDIKVTPRVVKIGDRVQATVKGQDLFPDGATVLGFSDDGEWIFTDQAKGGLKLEEITVLDSVQTPPVGERPSIPPSLLRDIEEKQPAGTRKAVFPVGEGDVSITYPEALTKEGLDELGMYLEVFLKKQKASVRYGKV